MRGRKPIPTALKIATGNRGRRPLNKEEPTPEPALLNPPEDLPEEALPQWKSLSAQLYDLGMISELDRDCLEAYCYCYLRWKTATKKVKIFGGAVVFTRNKNIIQNPWQAEANKALEQMRSFLTELGLSPASRSRVKTTAKKPTNLFEDYRRRREALRLISGTEKK